MTEGRLLTVAEAATEFFVTEKAIRRWMERGLLTWHEPGLLLAADVAVVESMTRRKSRTKQLLALIGADGASSAANRTL